VYAIPEPTKSRDAPEAVRIYSVDVPGHRTDVRTLALSTDDQILASASNGETRPCLSLPAADSASKAPSKSGTSKRQLVSGLLNVDMQYLALFFLGIAMSVFLLKRYNLMI
jgi:hypothetical protein